MQGNTLVCGAKRIIFRLSLIMPPPELIVKEKSRTAEDSPARVKYEIERSLISRIGRVIFLVVHANLSYPIG